MTFKGYFGEKCIMLTHVHCDGPANLMFIALLFHYFLSVLNSYYLLNSLLIIEIVRGLPIYVAYFEPVRNNIHTNTHTYTKTNTQKVYAV